MKANRRRNQAPVCGTLIEALTSRRLGCSSSSGPANRHADRDTASASDIREFPLECIDDASYLRHGSTLCNRLYFIVCAFCDDARPMLRGQSLTPVAPVAEWK